MKKGGRRFEEKSLTKWHGEHGVVVLYFSVSLRTPCLRVRNLGKGFFREDVG